MPLAISKLPLANFPLAGSDILIVDQPDPTTPSGLRTKRATIGNLPLSVPVQSVKYYGAMGDGVTDDTVAIGKAFASGYAYFPPGVYITGTQVVNNNLVVRGSGRFASKLFLRSGTQNHVVFINGDYDLDWEDMGLDGNYAQQGTLNPNFPCGVLSPIGSGRIVNSYFTNCLSHCIHIGNTDYLYDTNKFCHDWEISGNMVTQPLSGTQDCIRIHRGQRIRAHHNQTYGGLSSIRSNWYCQDINLSLNLCRNNSGDVGVTLAMSSDVAAVGNICSGNGFNGIEVDACNRGAVVGNVLSSNLHYGFLATEYGPAGGTALFTGTIASNVLTVSGITGTITAGQVVGGPGVTAPLTIQPFGSGGTTGTGGNGTYQLSATATLGPAAMGSASPAFSGYVDGVYRSYPNLYSNNDLRVDSNTVSLNQQFGMYFIGQSGVSVNNNIIDGNNAGNVNPYGLYISGGTTNQDDVSVGQNRFKNTGFQLNSIGQGNVQGQTRSTGGNICTTGTKLWQSAVKGTKSNDIMPDPSLLLSSTITGYAAALVEDTLSETGYARTMVDTNPSGNITSFYVIPAVPLCGDKLVKTRVRTLDTMTSCTLTVQLYLAGSFVATATGVSVTGLTAVYKEFLFRIPDSLKSTPFDSAKLQVDTDIGLTGTLNVEMVRCFTTTEL